MVIIHTTQSATFNPYSSRLKHLKPFYTLKTARDSAWATERSAL